MKIAIITDSHAGVKGDAPYVLDNQEKFYKELFFPYIINNGIERIIHGGDFFDRRKYINFLTLYRIKEMYLDVLKEYNLPMDIIAGNHDCYYKNTNKVNSVDLLLKEYSNISHRTKPEVVQYGSTSFMFVPWINNENYSETMEFIDKNDADVLVGHLEIEGFEMYAGTKADHGMSRNLFKKFKEVWSGHFHHKSSSGNIKYLGAPMEFTFADCDDPRGFHVYDTETKELTFIQNPYKLFERFYYDDGTSSKQDFIRNFDVSQFQNKIVKIVVANKTNSVLFETFVDSIYQQNIIDLSIIENVSEFAAENVQVEIEPNVSTKDLMEKYVESVDTDMDKDRIKSIMSGLYVEALNTSKSHLE